MSDQRPKPRGSGVYAMLFGFAFLIGAIVSFSGAARRFVIDHVNLSIGIWCAVVGASLLLWGFGRVLGGDKNPGDPQHRRGEWSLIGQETIGFVMSLVAATIGLLALFHDLLKDHGK